VVWKVVTLTSLRQSLRQTSRAAFESVRSVVSTAWWWRAYWAMNDVRSYCARMMKTAWLLGWVEL